MKEALVFDKVYFSYDGEEVLKDVSFVVNEGEIITVVGPNGGGKTTLLKLILGFLKPDFGKIYVFGRNPQEAKGLIGYLPQFSSVDRSIPITAFEFVKLSLYPGVFKGYSMDINDRVSYVLKIVDAYNIKDKPIFELSGGQFQRILLARAIVNDPPILLLDEPTNFIDENSKKSFYEIIMSFKGAKTILIVSHDLNMVSKFTDRLFCLNREIFISCKIGDLGKNLDIIYSNLFSYVNHRHGE